MTIDMTIEREWRRPAAALVATICLLGAARAEASGACCSITKGRGNGAVLAMVASSARSHEELGGERFELSQQATLFKLSYPLSARIAAQAQVGIPLASRLSHHGEANSDRSGSIVGAGLAWMPPPVIPGIELAAAVSYTHSRGNVSDGDSHTPSAFVISEWQGILLAEQALGAATSLYGGLRVYSGRNRLDRVHGESLRGTREGSVSPLLGFRFDRWTRTSLVVEAGFGHTRVVSIGTVISL